MDNTRRYRKYCENNSQNRFQYVFQRKIKTL